MITKKQIILYLKVEEKPPKLEWIRFIIRKSPRQPSTDPKRKE